MESKQEFKHLVRIANTDIDGNSSLHSALTKIHGIGFMMANAVCSVASVDKYAKVGNLDENAVNRIDDIIKEPSRHGIPDWLMNRRRDSEDGVSKHIITATLKFVNDNDIKMMKKIKCYKGIRHSMGQPVRGQRTRSNFRKSKGKVHLGVKVRGSKGGKV